MWQRLEKQHDAETQPAKGQYRRPWIWRLAILAAILVIAAIVIPIAVVMSRRRNSAPFTPKANVLVPLYVYPAPGAWDPLYSAANASTSLNFVVVVNPASGPGNDSLPDQNYIDSITKLRTLKNVQVIGYVPLGYGKNSINDVRRQVQTYSAWASNNSKLTIDGIFYDESPHDYSDSIAAYIPQTRDAIDKATGLKNKITVFNSGVKPEANLYTSTNDVVVVFEETYDKYQTSLDKLSPPGLGRDQTCIIVHSVPKSASMKDLADSMSNYANYVFATDLTVHANGNPYEAFGSVWQSLISSMPM